MAERIRLERTIVTENDRLAAALAERFDQAGLLAVNLMSSPGAGKTSLLEQTARRLAGRLRMAAVDGDLATDRDARRIVDAGMPCRQINTGRGCHLNGRQVAEAIEAYNLAELDILFIENVGNLVCPASFDLGEHRRVVVSSTPEGDDKPAKYPVAFLGADCVVLNKIDLVDATDFSLEAYRGFVRDLGIDVPLLELSCKTGEGLDAWFDWLRAQRGAVGRRTAPSSE
ncbi:MAG TPA: hydrogenase nickel incorporation protein HypB [Phycisphaerae bacterium]|nr:hydrogenase nickel incorporation protein HypB [Phycisphaerae bacterium]